jgi:hypothetical protein
MYYHYQVLAIVFGFLSEGDLELKKSGCLVLYFHASYIFACDQSACLPQ